jgi:archaellum component FlaC
MTDDEAISLREYIQDRLKDMDKAVTTGNATIQRSLTELKDELDEVRTLHGAVSGKYVTIEMFQANMTQRFESVDRLAKQLVDTVDFRFQTIEKSTALAATSIEHRLESMNEFRAQLAEEQNRFMQRTEYEGKHADLIARVENLDKFTRDAKEQHHLFITHDEQEAFRKEMVARFEAAETARENIATRVASLEKIYANLQGRIWAIGIGITILSIAIATLLHFIPV